MTTLTTLLLVASPARAQLGDSAASAQNAAAVTDPWKALEPDGDERVVSRQGRAASPAGNSPPRAAAAGPSWTRTVAALAAVVALIALLAWGYRAFGGGGVGHALRQRRPGIIQIISRAPISPRQSLCLVRVGPRLVLIGVSPDRMQSLDVIADAELTARLAGSAHAHKRDSTTAEFDASLRSAEQTYDAAQPPTAGALAGLASVLQRIRGTARA